MSSSGVRPSQRHSRVRHGSYTRQGLEKTPGIHLGKSACAMETRGIETERGEQNRLINRLNLEIQ
ncbi:hypothetical protein ACSLPB_29410, partial [Escherichia coli]|uniref:hypothetical protein n=1 Tax=Escherichia coli TaxID=562 RepID=UPI003EE24B74